LAAEQRSGTAETASKWSVLSEALVSRCVRMKRIWKRLRVDRDFTLSTGLPREVALSGSMSLSVARGAMFQCGVCRD